MGCIKGCFWHFIHYVFHYRTLLVSMGIVVYFPFKIQSILRTQKFLGPQSNVVAWGFFPANPEDGDPTYKQDTTVLETVQCRDEVACASLPSSDSCDPGSYCFGCPACDAVGTSDSFCGSSKPLIAFECASQQYGDDSVLVQLTCSGQSSVSLPFWLMNSALVFPVGNARFDQPTKAESIGCE